MTLGVRGHPGSIFEQGTQRGFKKLSQEFCIEIVHLSILVVFVSSSFLASPWGAFGSNLKGSARLRARVF